MRDPRRIPKVLWKLWRLWRRYPDMCFGQLVINLLAIQRGGHGAMLDGSSQVERVWNAQEDLLLQEIGYALENWR